MSQSQLRAYAQPRAASSVFSLAVEYRGACKDSRFVSRMRLQLFRLDRRA